MYKFTNAFFFGLWLPFFVSSRFSCRVFFKRDLYFSVVLSSTNEVSSLAFLFRRRTSSLRSSQTIIISISPANNKATYIHTHISEHVLFFMTLIVSVDRLVIICFRLRAMTSLGAYFQRIRTLSIVSLFLFGTSIQSIPLTPNNSSSTPLLLLISFDGFRWDYPDIYSLPHFDSIAQRGVRLKHIENSFATVTFPSHFTMITGLFEESHGIVANTIYDPVMNKVATIGTMNDPRWWYVDCYRKYRESEFILGHKTRIRNRFGSRINCWAILVDDDRESLLGQDVIRRSMNNSPRNIKHTMVRARLIRSWNKSSLGFTNPPRRESISVWSIILNRISPVNIISIVFVWRASVLCWSIGHAHGPISSEMNETLRECDNYVAQLLQVIDQDEYLKTHLNVIITSDHGMHDVDKKRRIVLEELIDKTLFSAYGGRSFANIFVNKCEHLRRKNRQRHWRCSLPSSVRHRPAVRESLHAFRLRSLQEISNTRWISLSIQCSRRR